MKRSLFLLLMVGILSLTACFSNPGDKLIGAWKSEKTADLSTKPTIIILTKDRLQINKSADQAIGIIYEDVANQINVISATSKSTVLVASNIEKDSVEFERSWDGKRKYIRISEQEANKIIQESDKFGGKNRPAFPE